MGHFRPLILYFSPFQYSWELTMFNINFANDWIWTADLWSWEQPLYQLSHNHCPFNNFVKTPFFRVRSTKFSTSFFSSSRWPAPSASSTPSWPPPSRRPSLRATPEPFSDSTWLFIQLLGKVLATAVLGLRPLYGWTGCCIIGHTPLMQWLEVIIARLDHHGEYRWSNWPRYVGTWFAPPFTPDFLGKVGLNIALGLVSSCCSCQTA